MAYPAWWADGAEVMDSGGQKGQLHWGADGWFVVFNPGPSIDHEPSTTGYTQINKALGITAQQSRRICYELERAILTACGRGGGTVGWDSLPEGKRASAADVHPVPLGPDQLSFVRMDAVDAVRAALLHYKA